jgi:hypothetical protein
MTKQQPMKSDQQPTNLQLLMAIKEMTANQEVWKNEFKSDLQESFQKFKDGLASVGAVIKDVQTNVSTLQQTTIAQDQKIKYLEASMNTLRQKECSNKCIIFGVPTTADSTDTVINISKIIHIDIQPSDILFCTRTNSKTTNNNQPIVVNFINNNIAQKFVSAQKKIGPISLLEYGNHTKINVECFLTQYYVNLLKKTKLLKSALNFKYVWYQSCSIYIKKSKGEPSHRIRDDEDLQKLTTLLKSVS